MTILNLLLNLLFPRRCISCGRVGKYFCPKCISMNRFIDTTICPICERPAISGATHPKCQTRYSLDGLTSFFVYDGVIKKAIKQLKYRFVADLASELVNIALASQDQVLQYCKTWSYKTNIYLTPVPLHWRRQNWRGFNQSDIFGRQISVRLGLRFIPDLLIREKFTQPQVELRSNKRKENIRDAFVINPAYISANQRAAKTAIHANKEDYVSQNQRSSKPAKVIPSNLILFDDVWTTGSTLKACCKTLKQAGVKWVWGMTFAR